MEKKFQDQSINYSIKQYDEVRKILTGPGNDCTIGCLLDFTYFEKNYRLIAADLSKQKVLDADSRANYFYWKSNSTHKSYLHS